jgi:hypothetical protein
MRFMAERNDLVPFEQRIARQRQRYAAATADEIAELAANFPAPFVDEVRRHGWCSMAGGAFWTVSGRYLAPALADWQLDAPVQAFARNALGDVYVACRGRVVVLGDIGVPTVDPYDVLDFLNFALNPDVHLRKSELKRFKRELGPIRWDECYTYVPAPPINTTEERQRDRGKLLPYLSIIGQLVAPVAISEPVAQIGQPGPGSPREFEDQLLSLLADAKNAKNGDGE